MASAIHATVGPARRAGLWYLFSRDAQRSAVSIAPICYLFSLNA
ncbi:MAG: hypothetical protein SFX18_13560 [Pirellulales bacterium]|nr:hypothetical protein [Pirellulales bacterium]